jgi:hypothetical protein
VLTTAGELARFARLHLEDDDLAALRQTRYDRGVHAWFDAWGRGIARFDWDGGTAWGWSGVTDGQRAELRILPEQRGAIALLTNASSGKAMYRSLVADLGPRLLGVRPPVLRLATRGDVDVDPSAYVGTYTWPERVYEVRLDAGRPVLVRDGRIRPLEPLDERVFVVDRANPDVPTITFDRFDEHGRPGVVYVMVWGIPRR